MILCKIEMNEQSVYHMNKKILFLFPNEITAQTLLRFNLFLFFLGNPIVLDMFKIGKIKIIYYILYIFNLI